MKFATWLIFATGKRRSHLHSSFIAKLFEKLYVSWLQKLVEVAKIIPAHQFDFQAKHSIIQQVHRVSQEIRESFRMKKFCPAVFLDVSQVFDWVRIEDFLHKTSLIFAKQYVEILGSYHLGR